MKAIVKIEFGETTKTVTANTKVELEGDCKSDEDLKRMKQLAADEGKELFEWAYAQSKRWSMGK